MKMIQLNTLKNYKDFDERYWVQEDGQIWTSITKKYLSQHKSYNSKKLQQLWENGQLDKEPYYIMKVGLYKKNAKQPTVIGVHQLVATAFVPNNNNLPEVNHIDKNTSNNHYTNLEWISKENNIKQGLSKKIWQCDKITHQHLKLFNSISDAEREGFNRPNIIAVLKGRRKSAGNFFWEYN